MTSLSYLAANTTKLAHNLNLVVCALLLSVIMMAPMQHVHAQDEEKDTSKPTNLYTFLDNSLEYTSTKTANIYGYRANLNYAPHPDHLGLIEVPLLYNDLTEKGGLGDIRLRYFWTPYKNYDRFVGAFAPSIDVFLPTGKLEDGLGVGSYAISPGIMVGLMLSDKVQTFPILSYQYTSKSVSDTVPDSLDKVLHGLTIQSITSFVFSPLFFMQVTPIYAIPDLDDSKKSGFAMEVLAVYTLTPRLQVSAFARPDFKNEITTARVGLTVFL